MPETPTPLPWRFWGAAKRLAHRSLGTRCAVCGQRSIWNHKKVLWPELIDTWEIDPTWVQRFDQREGTTCARCGIPRRSEHMARVLLDLAAREWGIQADTFRDLCHDRRFHERQVAELNSCGLLHESLAAHPGLQYSEYRAKDPAIRSEDLMALSYPDRSFDLVLTSETLEHVPVLERALGEIYRVLKPGGFHVCTVPVVWDRPATRERVRWTAAGAERILPPSYHGVTGDSREDYLVFREFGADVVTELSTPGVVTSAIVDARNPALSTFVSRRPE